MPFYFCKAMIDATADLTCSFKPQIAYFAALRAEDQLEALCRYIKTTYPAIPVILDAKRVTSVPLPSNTHAKHLNDMPPMR
jgi:orotidine-5'-phosphate decarboxylase